MRSRPRLVVALGGASKPSIIYGASHGDGTGGLSETLTNLKPKMVRLYENDKSTPSTHTWAASAGSPAGLTAGLGICYSSNPGIELLAARSIVTSSTYWQTILAWRNILGGAPDDGTDLHHILRHEPVIHSTLKTSTGFTPAQFVQATLNWKSDVIDYVNTQMGRTNKWSFDLAGTAFSLDTAAGTAQYVQCYNDEVCAVADVVGSDCYKGQQLQEAADFAASHNKPWSVPEFGGPQAGQAHGAFSDATLVGYMKQWTPTIKNIKSSGVANPPDYALWFNGNGTYITSPGGVGNPPQTPLSQAYWLSVDQGKV